MCCRSKCRGVGGGVSSSISYIKGKLPVHSSFLSKIASRAAAIASSSVHIDPLSQKKRQKAQTSSLSGQPVFLRLSLFKSRTMAETARNGEKCASLCAPRRAPRAFLVATIYTKSWGLTSEYFKSLALKWRRAIKLQYTKLCLAQTHSN